MKRLAYLFVLTTSAAHAEVMDKEPSLVVVGSTGIAVALILFVLARFRPLLLLVAGPLWALLAYGQWAELTDPYVRPDIVREAGTIYLVISWAATSISIIVVVVGLWLRRQAASPNNSLKSDVAKPRALG